MKKLDFLPNLKNKYSIRRFTVGTASILIGSLLFLGHNTETQAAEETDNPTEAEVANETNDNHSSTQETQNVPSETATQPNKDDSANNLKDVQNQALQQVSALQHLSAEQSSSFTNEIKNAVSQAFVQAVVEKALAADNQAAQQVENENKQPVKEPETVEEPKNEIKNEATKEDDSKVEQPTENQETKQKSVEAESKVKADNSKTDEVEHQAATPAPEAKENKEVNPVHTENNIASENLATEQKVEKVKAELSAQRSTEEVDEALALIDTEGLTAEEIKAEVTKLLFKRGLAEKEFYSPKAVLPRKEDEPVYSTRAAFDINTDLKDEVVVTKDNFNDYFWTVDDASYDPETGIATLTPNEPSKKGAITLDTKLNVNKDFHFSGEVNLGDKYEGHPKNGEAGGDGISFAFNPGKTHDLGLYGSALGVGGLPFAFGFKLDTYVNNSPKAAEKAGPDPKPFDTKGAFGAFVWADGNGRVTTQPGTGTWKAALLNEPPEDNKFRPFTIDYDGDTKDMTITYAGQTWKQNMKGYFNYTHKDVYALGITASTGGGYNLQQVKINEFTYTASALLAEYFVDQDLQKPIDKPLRTSGDIDSIVDVLDHSAYLQSKGYQLVSKDTSLAPEYNAAASNIKLTNASQFIVYAVKDIQAPEIGEVPAATGELNAPITPIVLDVTDNSGSVASTQVTGLPAGLTFDEKTNTISGTPTVLGNNTVTITATDHAGLKTEKTFTFTVADSQKPTIDTVENKTSEAFTPIIPIVLSADDNSKVAPTLTVTGLPAGLTFDPATKQITGTLTAEGTSTVTITATDASNNTSTSTFEYTVQPNAALNALKAAVADAKTVNKDDYTPDSVKALEDKVAEGEALLAHPENGTPEQFNAKAQEIKDAKDALKQKADKDELNKSITAAEALPPLKAGNPLDDAVKNALEKAKEVQANQNADQPAVDKAKTDLDNAVNAKKAADEKEKAEVAAAAKAKQDALDALKEELAKVEKLNKDDYTPETVQPLSEKETAGKAVVADADNKSVDEIKEATEALKQAENDLVKKANKDELEKSIAKAEGLGQLDPTDAEDKAVQDAVAAGQKVKDDADATPEQVAKATKDINDAVAAKERQDALDELNKAIDAAQRIEKADYTAQSVAPLDTAKQAGEKLAADNQATTEQLKEATKLINDAINQLVPDKSELDKIIEVAKGLEPLNNSATDQLLKHALDAAIAVQNNANATPQEIKEATWNLEDEIGNKLAVDAIEALRNAVNKSKALKEENYTPDSFAPLKTATTEGQSILDDPSSADVPTIMDKTKEINQLIDALKEKADKTALEEALDKAVAYENLDDNDAEDKAVHDALLAGQEVEGDLNATPEEVQKATEDLNKAIAAKEHQDALDELNKAIDAANAVTKDDFTPNSVKSLEDAVKAGETVKADAANKTPEELKAAAKAINDAKDALQAKADKDGLNNSIQTAEGLGNLDSEDAEDKAVKDALDNAKAVQEDQNVTQAEVNQAKTDLDNAIKAKQDQDAKDSADAAKAKQDALDELKAELAKVEKLNKDDYTPNTVAPLNEKETAGNAVVADADKKSVDEIKEATEALKQAQNNLVKKADKAELEKSIQAAEGLGNLDPADAEDKAVKDALDKAKAVQADPNVTQAEADAAKDALNKAVQAKADQDKADAIQAALDALKKAIDRAKTTSTSNCTEQSVKVLEEAVKHGESIIKGAEKASLKVIQNATEAINKAIDELEAKKTTVAPTDKTKTEVQSKTNVENSVTEPASQTNIKHKHHTTKETAKNKAKVLPNTGQDSTSVDPKYASLMFAIGGLMMFFRKRKNEDKDNTEK